MLLVAERSLIRRAEERKKKTDEESAYSKGAQNLNFGGDGMEMGWADRPVADARIECALFGGKIGTMISPAMRLKRREARVDVRCEHIKNHVEVVYEY